jgi:hypothetical protein
VALFPDEWLRNPASPYLTTGVLDAPWEEPELMRECLRPAWAERGLAARLRNWLRSGAALRARDVPVPEAVAAMGGAIAPLLAPAKAQLGAADLVGEIVEFKAGAAVAEAAEYAQRKPAEDGVRQTH